MQADVRNTLAPQISCMGTVPVHATVLYAVPNKAGAVLTSGSILDAARHSETVTRLRENI